MAAFNRLQIGLRATGTTVTTPDAPEAELMYYLNCICCVLQLDNTAQMRRLRDYREYYLLDEDDLMALLLMCILLSPDELIGKCIFQDDDMCGDSNNEFYEISAVNTSLVVTDSIVIGGERRRVQKIMVFKMSWLRSNYFEPLQRLNDRLKREREGKERREAAQRRSVGRTSQTCRIL